MSRRQDLGSDSDSLDTFLDTVCCLFGIIIFIAILIAILVQLTTKEVILEVTASDEQMVEAITRLEERKDALAGSIESYRESESLSNLMKIGEGESDLETLQAELEKRDDILKTYKTALRSGARDVNELIDAIPAINEEIQALEAMQKAKSLLMDRPMRTPQRTAVDTRPTTFLLVNGKLYETNPWDMRGGRSFEENGGWCYMMTTWNTTDVDQNNSRVKAECFGNSGLEFRHIKLRKEGGLEISLDRPLLEDPAFREMIRRYDAKEQMVYFTVATNSFEEFGLVRAAFSEKRFRYDIFFAPESFSDTLTWDEHWVVGKPSAQ